jgi:3',5'-cyclic AMP phosphodiesterase CpdA
MANGGLISIGLCADTHYWPKGENYVTSDGSLQLQGSTQDLLATLFQELRNAQLDVVLHLGDLTCGGGTYDMAPEAFKTTVVDLYRTYQSLDVPVYVLPGNHDSLPGAGGWDVFHEVWGLEPGLGTTLDLPLARLILLNTHGHSPAQIAQAEEFDPVYGWVSSAELARLEEALASAGTRPVLVFTHQLLAPWSNHVDWHDYFAVRNAAAVRNVLSRHRNVAAVFQAHAHRFDVRRLALGDHESTFVILPSLIEYPLAWVQLDLAPELLRMRLRQLPLPQLQDATRTSGRGQEWRAGRPEWWDLTIPLRVPFRSES